MNHLSQLVSPQLKKLHSGKVRESFRVDNTSRLIVATDRISCFDFVLDTPVPGKGSVLNSLAAFWFEHTRDIIDNHLIRVVDPSASLVREAQPIPVEMIVRGYLTGSAWRAYQSGRREVSGVAIPDGMTLNQAFSQPIVTPTTKEKNDREISRENLFSEGWVRPEIYAQMEHAALALFERGTRMLAERGIVLVDTKYEFGLINGKVILIDEIHTPDSSRFWSKPDYDANPESVEQLDKEYVRSYLLKNKVNGEYRKQLPNEVVAETTRRYHSIYRMITGQALAEPKEDVLSRLRSNLVQAGLMKDGYVAVIMGSPGDVEHCRKIQKVVQSYDVHCELRVVSAHKNGEAIPQITADYQESIEPVAIIAVAGRSNGLGGALSANLAVPVISCPPFSDKADLLVNLHSSLMMPSYTPAATIVDTTNAALFAVKALNLSRLRKRMVQEIIKMKEDLAEADKQLRDENTL
jgi:phosphoribosylaminoimidazole-succinocarboxamide synthase